MSETSPKRRAIVARLSDDSRATFSEHVRVSSRDSRAAEENREEKTSLSLLVSLPSRARATA